MRCVFCTGPVDAQRDYRQVLGFEKRRDAGGTNALRLRRPLDVWACRGCVEKEARGVGALQGDLFGSSDEPECDIHEDGVGGDVGDGGEGHDPVIDVSPPNLRSAPHGADERTNEKEQNA